MEKVYCAHNQHDGTILSGTADLNYNPFYFSCLFDHGPNDDWAYIYELTPLDDRIFNLELQNWEYWLFWRDTQFEFGTANKIPHPVHYADIRKTKEFDAKIFPNAEIADRAEKYYQNQIIIDDFLKRHEPTTYARAIFDDDRNAIDTRVEWKIVDKPDLNASG